MGWLSEYEWTSPMQTTVSEWEKFLAKCYPNSWMDSAALLKEFQAGARVPSEKYIKRCAESNPVRNRRDK